MISGNQRMRSPTPRRGVEIAIRTQRDASCRVEKRIRIRTPAIMIGY
jgi:hypothetical protein